MVTSLFLFAILFKLPAINNGKIESALMMSIEIICILLIRIHGPKIRFARLFSGILVFIASLITIFSSFGTGLVVYLFALLCFFFIIIGNYSKNLLFITIPLTSYQIYVKILLNIVRLDSAENTLKLLNNISIIVLIYPALFILNCSEVWNQFKLKLYKELKSIKIKIKINFLNLPLFPRIKILLNESIVLSLNDSSQFSIAIFMKPSKQFKIP